MLYYVLPNIAFSSNLLDRIEKLNRSSVTHGVHVIPTTECLIATIFTWIYVCFVNKLGIYKCLPRRLSISYIVSQRCPTDNCVEIYSHKA